MPITILMPALSPTMTHGNLLVWHKAEGDMVKSGEILAEIETDKATMEVEAADDGILLKIVVPAGTQSVQVNSLIAILGEENESLEGLNLSDKSPQDRPTPSTPELREEHLPVTLHVSSEAKERVIASPLAKKLAQRYKVSLETLQGSGPGGRIIAQDVERAHQIMMSSAHSGSSVTVPDAKKSDFSGFEPAYQALPVSTMRQVIANRLTESKQSIPHFYISASCEMDFFLEVRQDLNQGQESKISVNDMIIKACALALMKVPEANSAWAQTHIHQYHQADIAVAVSMPGGLFTPIIRAAERKGLQDISQEMKDLVIKTRSGKLKPEEYQGGTFCLSNLGMYGVESFNAILNPPQACILAVGATQPRPVIRQGRVESANVMVLTLSVDHRVIDGAVAAQFLKILKGYLENPVLMLL